MKRFRKYLLYSRTMLQDLHCLRWALASESEIAYIGWLGRGNLGDEAMYLSHQQRLPGGQRLSKAPINRYGRQLASLAGRPVARTLLIGGGTLLGHSGWLKPIMEARNLLKPNNFVVLGAGMEDVDFALASGLATETDLKLWGALLNEADYVGVRGPRSQINLARIGVKSEVVGDAALWFKSQTSILTTHGSRDRPYVAINVVGNSNGFDAHHRDRGGQMFAYARGLADIGLDVVFFGMERRDVHEARILQTQVPSIQVMPWSPSVINVVNLIQNSEFVVSERLHGAILAAAAAVPFTMLAYKPKCYDFAESVRALDACMDPKSLSADVLMERTMAVLSGRARVDAVNEAKSALSRRFDQAHAMWLIAA